MKNKNNNIKVAAILGVSIIIAAIILSSSGAFRSTKDHCYFKIYKHFKSEGRSDSSAATIARARCK